MLSSHKSQCRVALIIDGSAFFFALLQAFRGERLEYPRLLEFLRQYVTRLLNHPVDRFEPAIYFTSTDPANEGQKKFNTFLGTLGLTIVTDEPWNADVCNRALIEEDKPFRHIRFDSPIAYTLGALVASKQAEHVIIVSDSFALRRPILDAISRKVGITLSFFAQYIDPRWQQFIAEENLQFLDLSANRQQIFSGVTTPITKTGIPGLVLR